MPRAPLPQPTALRPSEPNVGTLLLEVYRRFEDELFAGLHREGHAALRPKHGRVLANLDREGMRATALAERARMTKPSMGELIAELEELGYLRREPDPADGRAKLVVLTARGLEVAELAQRVIARIERGYARTLGPRALASLRKSLRALSEDRPDRAS